MFNVMNLVPLDYNQVFFDISENFFNHIPENTFVEVSDPDEADIFFTFVQKDEDDFNHILRHRLHNNEEMYTLTKNLRSKPRIIWFDTLNPNIPHQQHNTYPDFVMPYDIPVAPTLLPEHPNKQDYVFHIDDKMFYPLNRYYRKENSVVIAADQFRMFFGNILDILPSISHLHVTGMEIFGDEYEHPFWNRRFSNYSCSMEDHPVGIRKILSQFHYIFTLRDHFGMEVMGFEAGFCGCYPIYPNNMFFNDIFKETGVFLFDTNNSINSIRDFLEKDNVWDGYKEDFIQKFKAENNLPQFWHNVYNILESQ